ncbi:unnamed protein product [Brassica napus]|uniref:(rape) hypothetical protein n=1 Tax=Brassica napus TaxID=3708 RepID=A0A816K4I5_BRANA|nr:unnamed protein product [Brassica napus]
MGFVTLYLGCLKNNYFTILTFTFLKNVTLMEATVECSLG